MFGEKKNTHSRITEAVRKARAPVAWYFSESFLMDGDKWEFLKFLAQYGSAFSFSWRLSKEVLHSLVDTVHHENPSHCCLLDGRDCRPEEAKKFVSLLCELGVQGCIVPEAVARKCWKHDRFIFMTGNGSPEELAEKAAGKSRFNTQGRQNAGCAFLALVPHILSPLLEKSAHLLTLIEPPIAMRERMGYAAIVASSSFVKGKCIIQLPVTMSLISAKGGWRLDEGVVQIAKELRDSFQSFMATTRTAI